jgi:hypothetical protein
LNGVTLNSFELQTIPREDNLDIDLFASPVQVTELVITEREILEFSRGYSYLVLFIIYIDSLFAAYI